MDERAQAHGLIVFFAMLAIGALLFTILQSPADSIFTSFLASTDSQQAREAIELRETIFGYILVWVMFVSALFLIARSVLQSRSPG